MNNYSGVCSNCGRYGESDGPMDELCPACQRALDDAPRLRLILIDPTQNVGCTSCGQQATFVTVYEDGHVLEIVESACPIHVSQ